MARVEVDIEGFDKHGRSLTQASKVMNGAQTAEFIMWGINKVKGEICVGEGGRHVITVYDGQKRIQRVDQARRGANPPSIGKFKEIQVNA